MIEIHPESNVYIFCPAHFATGGPEALHQMAFALKQLGIHVSMIYFNQEDENPVHPNYAGFNIPFGQEVVPSASSVFILPETYLKPNSTD
ncbi:MAG: hypothetical protein EOO88_28485 [Pedobacter sp.]|nr:MAG: hypothetical protein EOO88_28485 [Pedobacter sp.]